MKRKLLTLVAAASLAIAGCSSKNQKELDEEKVSDAQLKETNQVSTSHLVKGSSLEKKLSELRRKPKTINALEIIECKTVYNSDFKPTVHLEVINNTKTNIIGFEVTNEETGYTKRFKVSLKPGRTFRTTLQPPIDSEDEVLGDIYLSINRFVYQGGELVEFVGNGENRRIK